MTNSHHVPDARLHHVFRPLLWQTWLQWLQPGTPHLDLFSLSRRTSYHKISRSFEAAIYGFKLFQSLCLRPTRQQRCRDACQIIEIYDQYNTESRGLETSRYLAVRHLTAIWMEAKHRFQKTKAFLPISRIMIDSNICLTFKFSV